MSSILFDRPSVSLQYQTTIDTYEQPTCPPPSLFSAIITTTTTTTTTSKTPSISTTIANPPHQSLLPSSIMAGETSPGADRPRSPPDREGLLSRVWRGIFVGRGEDYEKRLECLSREEAAVLTRMRRRAVGSKATLRDFIACSVALEVAAVAYAIMMTRSDNLHWQLRAVKIIPMFLIPGLSFGIYSAVVSFTKMCDHRDQQTLDRLRAERQAKIDELKERTNFYSTQQLIQRYDLDPAAKAAAAAVLASKLSADSGLRVSVADAPIFEEPSWQSNDVKLPSSEGLRNRKHSARSHSNDRTPNHELSGETPEELVPDAQLAPAPSEQVVDHYKGPATYDGGWFARLAAMLVGEDPTQCYALICGTCHMHNGLARKEDFPYITYYCPHCHALNTNQQLDGSGPEPDSNSGNPDIHNLGSVDITPEVADGDSSATQVEKSMIPPSGEEEVGQSTGQS